MRPLRVLVVLAVDRPGPTDEEIGLLKACGWSLTLAHVAKGRAGDIDFSLDLLADIFPQIVHLRGVPPVSVLLNLRVRGLPVLLEHESSLLERLYGRWLTTLAIPIKSDTRYNTTRLHYLYLAALNLAFAPPSVRSVTSKGLIESYD
jgi:hypothetical protein